MLGKKGTKHIPEGAGNVALVFLKLLSSSADAFPPVKIISSVAVSIVEMALAFKSNQHQWSEFGTYVETTVSIVIQFIPNASETGLDDLKNSLQNLENILGDIHATIQSMCKRSFFARLWAYWKDPDAITEMKNSMNNVLSGFHLQTAITTGVDAARTQQMAQNIEKYVQLINGKLSDKIASNMALNTLPYAEGASWNPTRICLRETRIPIKEVISQWVNDIQDKKGAEIFCIADVAGAGKSALAHSVAKHCYDSKILGSSFFFDRETADRNTPKKFITTLARDLSLLSKDIAQLMALVIENEPGIVMSQSITRQFHKLLLEPFSKYPIRRPVAIVIDALDEGYDEELLKILCCEIPNLPPCIRIFLTTRPEEDLTTLLFHTPHVHHQTLDIHDKQNLSDIAVYARSRLQEVSVRKGMGSHWPSRQVIEEFTEMAEGLFIWASTICDYLQHSTAPERKLNALIKDRNLSGVRAEEKMIKLYHAILSAYDWSDDDFVQGYYLVMGAIIALKTPLSIVALQSLHKSIELRVSEVTLRLAPLLTGSTQEEQPIRLPHLSLRSFLTHHSISLPDCQKFTINEKEHNQRLACLCLMVLYEDLKPGSPGTGYLETDINFNNMRLPEVPKKQVSEVLRYACQFWIDHVIDIGGPIKPGLANLLHKVLLERLIPWVELCTACGTFQSFKKLRNWVKMELPNDTQVHNAIYRPEVARKLTRLSYCNIIDWRRKEALECAKEASDISKTLAHHNPCLDNDAILAEALNALASRLVEMRRDKRRALYAAQAAVALREKIVGKKNINIDIELATYLPTLAHALTMSGKPEDALNAISRAVTLLREIATLNPKGYKSSLSHALNSLSARLANVGRYDDALQAAQETIQLCRELAMEDPRLYKSHLSTSLRILSARFAQLGRHEEALEATQECVQLQRETAAVGPAMYQVQLATSLNKLSLRLQKVNKDEEALEAAEEGMNIAKKLANENPDAFNANYSSSLKRLSTCLLNVGRIGEARSALDQAVQLNPEPDNDQLNRLRATFSLLSLVGQNPNLGHFEEVSSVAERAPNRPLLLLSVARENPELVHAEDASLATEGSANRPLLFLSLAALNPDLDRSQDSSLTAEGTNNRSLLMVSLAGQNSDLSDFQVDYPSPIPEGSANRSLRLLSLAGQNPDINLSNGYSPVSERCINKPLLLVSLAGQNPGLNRPEDTPPAAGPLVSLSLSGQNPDLNCLGSASVADAEGSTSEVPAKESEVDNTRLVLTLTKESQQRDAQTSEL